MQQPAPLLTLKAYLELLIKNEANFSPLLAIGASDRSDLVQGAEIDLDTRETMMVIGISRQIARNYCNQEKASIELQAAVTAFYRATTDYANRTKGFGNYTGIGAYIGLRKAVVSATDFVTNGANARKQRLEQVATEIERLVEVVNTNQRALGSR